MEVGPGGLAYAVLVMLIGLAALLNPLAAGLATSLLLDWGLLAHGVVAIVGGGGPRSRQWIEVLRGLVAFLFGILVLFDPLAGAMSLAWALSFWLVVCAMVQIIDAVRSAQDRTWKLLMAAVDLLLGSFLLFSGPSEALAFLALAVGISFLFRGTYLIAMALAWRERPRT
nr:DUF308 domain-containing protein [Sphingobium sp. DC-2]